MSVEGAGAPRILFDGIDGAPCPAAAAERQSLSDAPAKVAQT
ncbi:MAG: hypothetical protein PW790_07210 [Parvibaculaceae bacterium]|nr:hypothetical protein [Parvibaculaceae bacterium]